MWVSACYLKIIINITKATHLCEPSTMPYLYNQFSLTYFYYSSDIIKLQDYKKSTNFRVESGQLFMMILLPFDNCKRAIKLLY